MADDPKTNANRLNMTEPERVRLTDKLGEYSRRLDAHVRDLKERGGFTEIHRNLIEDIKNRQDQMEKKVAMAEADGVAWDVIKSEMERDYNSIFDDLLQITERLDADEMKSK